MNKSNTTSFALLFPQRVNLKHEQISHFALNIVTILQNEPPGVTPYIMYTTKVVLELAPKLALWYIFV